MKGDTWISYTATSKEKVEDHQKCNCEILVAATKKKVRVKFGKRCATCFEKDENPSYWRKPTCIDGLLLKTEIYELRPDDFKEFMKTGKIEAGTISTLKLIMSGRKY